MGLQHCSRVGGSRASFKKIPLEGIAQSGGILATCKDVALFSEVSVPVLSSVMCNGRTRCVLGVVGFRGGSFFGGLLLHAARVLFELNAVYDFNGDTSNK